MKNNDKEHQAVNEIENQTSPSDDTFLNLSESELSVGSRIIHACGGEFESGEQLYSIDETKIREGLREAIEMLKQKQEELKLNRKLKSSSLIQYLFVIRDSKNKIPQRSIYKAHTQVLIEFLEWLLEIRALDGRLNKISDLLKSMIFDLGATGFLGEKFFSPNCGRNKTNMTFFHFYECRNALFLNYPTPAKTQEFLSVFGLRQAMEIKFRRIIGYAGSKPSLKIKHEVIPEIISQSEKNIFFSKKKTISLKDIMHVYIWTNYSIHSMQSIYPWVIWKAFDVCQIMFDQNDDGPAHSRGFNSAFQFSFDTLQFMRKKLIEKAQLIANCENKTYKLYWNNPEAYILDEKNCTMNLDDEKKNETIVVSPCSREKNEILTASEV